ncbi:oligoribonuclease [Neobacillus cucumis]|uniref:DHH family phosphoesterase n=1 Tax=Neobacillus cucumis TaxID=1740721 RepID=UPI0018DF8CAF|nr:DHHA1 domain-containing protein [Neobacillus cucumis]MBI0575837.1 oligoribonuclease [Neobacillus cucumis]
MVKLFTDIDLDGLGCGIIAKIAFGENADVSYCSYRTLNQQVETYIENPENHGSQIYITDLAVNETNEKKLAARYKQGKHIRMIDHHVTALHFNEYKWAFVHPEYDTGKKTCATSLFYNYLMEQGLIQRNQALEEFIELVRQYDTWEWDENNNIHAKRLNDLFYILNREQFEEAMLKRFSENPQNFYLTETENMLLDMEEAKINRYIHSKSRQTVQAFIDEYCIGIIHAEQYLSELGNALNKLYPHLDMILLLNVSGKKVGYRTIHDEVNVAEYAKRFGGGGHPKASGSEMSAEAFEKFVIKVFSLPTLKPDPDKNEFNLKEAKTGTSYKSVKGEISFIRPVNENAYAVIHNGKRYASLFETYEEAERYIKRTYGSWLRYDQECIQQLAEAFSIKIDEVKEKYQPLVKKLIDKFDK